MRLLSKLHADPIGTSPGKIWAELDCDGLVSSPATYCRAPGVVVVERCGTLGR